MSQQVCIDELSSKLNKACYGIRLFKLLVSFEVLRLIYFYMFTIISYGIILGGNSSHSKIIFKTQKRIIRFISTRDSCHELFKNLEVLPFQSQYIFSLLLFVVKNRELFRSNSDAHNINTRYNSDLMFTHSKFNSTSKESFLFWN